MHRDAVKVPGRELDVPRVKPGADANLDVLECVDHRRGALNAALRTGEEDLEPVAGRPHLVATEPVDLRAQAVVVLEEPGAPPRVAEARERCRRVPDARQQA